MIFFSYSFFIFIALFFGAYWIFNGYRTRRWILLIGCASFHTYYAGPAGVLPILLLGLGTYFTGILRNRHLCIVWIIVCVAALVLFKYTYFFFDGIVSFISPDLSRMGVGITKGLLPELPPLAISFFTFEFIHYLIEIHRGHKPIRSPLTFALFAIFWPSLVAGPVKRYQQFVVSAARGMKQSGYDDVRMGMARVALGISKKLAADTMTPWINFWGDRIHEQPVEIQWTIFVALGVRIFLDFSGYSDMAIGFAKMMGIKLPENFNWPYLAVSINDFWKRWHISLSSWIRDYIYIPLGGNQCGIVRKVFNGFAAMAICGLWHGASWNFIVWGLYHGLGLTISNFLGGGIRHLKLRAMDSKFAIFSDPIFLNFSHRIWIFICWALTLLFVLFGWVLFFYPLDKAWAIIRLLLRV